MILTPNSCGFPYFVKRLMRSILFQSCLRLFVVQRYRLLHIGYPTQDIFLANSITKLRVEGRTQLIHDSNRFTNECFNFFLDEDHHLSEVIVWHFSAGSRISWWQLLSFFRWVRKFVCRSERLILSVRYWISCSAILMWWQLMFPPCFEIITALDSWCSWLEGSPSWNISPIFVFYSS